MAERKTCKSCTVGVWYDYEDSQLVSFEDLAKLVEEQIKMYESFKKMGYDKHTKIAPLETYFDKRFNVNFKLFDYCPYCGSEIDYKELKRRSQQLGEQENGER